MCKWCCARLPRYKYANYTMKVNNTEDFQMSSKWKLETLETRISNNALAVYCLLNQMTQMDKDCDTYNEYICIYGPEMAQLLFFFKF